MNFNIKVKPLPSQPEPDLCTEDFEVCKKCNRLGDKGDKGKGITKCTRFQSDYKQDNNCPRCGMSVGHGRHRCNVSMNHFERA